MVDVKHGWVVHHDQADHPVYTNTSAHSRCVQFWDAVARFHRQKFPGSAGPTLYSFGVCRHGDVFTGRGWTRNQAAGGADQKHTGYRDADWFSVLCFLGGNEQPTAAMYAGLAWLITQGRTSGRCGPAVIPHNQFRIKECPGPELSAWAQWADGNPDLGDDMSAQAEADIAAIKNFLLGGLTPDELATFNRGAYAILRTNHLVEHGLSENGQPVSLAGVHRSILEAMPTALDLEQLAGAIVARLPQTTGGTVAGPSLEQVKAVVAQALREVLKDGVG